MGRKKNPKTTMKVKKKSEKKKQFKMAYFEPNLT
jgi:hypothetical protein